MTGPLSKRTFRFSFSELGISRKEVEGLLGIDAGDDPGPFTQYIDAVLEVAGNLENITGGYVVFDKINFCAEEGTSSVNGIVFLTGKMVTAQLRKAASLAVFVCTAGIELEKYSREQMKSGNMPEGYIADVLGSVIVESAMNKVHALLAEEMLAKGSGTTNRYSPGYCGWNVSEQQKLFKLIPHGLCAVSLSESSLMNPIKSVSGIIGIGPGLKNVPYSCNKCGENECSHRNKKH